MQTSRFWAYYDYLNRYYESQKPVDKRESAINKAKSLDWTDEIKAAKHGKR